MRLDLSTRETLIASLPKNGIVAEIGVDNGDFSKKILELSEPKELHLIDCWNNQSVEVYGHDPANNSNENKYNQYRYVIDRFWNDRNVYVVKKYSDIAASYYPNNHFDWIFIDANHLQARQDIEAWWDKVKPGGYITGHDYTMVGDYITVKRDVNEFVKEHGLSLFVTTGEGGDIYEVNYPSWGFKKPMLVI
jgi:hypothetical protein